MKDEVKKMRRSRIFFTAVTWKQKEEKTYKEKESEWWWTQWWWSLSSKSANSIIRVPSGFMVFSMTFKVKSDLIPVISYQNKSTNWSFSVKMFSPNCFRIIFVGLYQSNTLFYWENQSLPHQIPSKFRIWQ